MEHIRLIIELPASAGPYSGLEGDDRQDAIVDTLIAALDTPEVVVLDTVEEGEPAWFRSERF